MGIRGHGDGVDVDMERHELAGGLGLWRGRGGRGGYRGGDRINLELQVAGGREVKEQEAGAGRGERDGGAVRGPRAVRPAREPVRAVLGEAGAGVPRGRDRRIVLQSGLCVPPVSFCYLSRSW